GGPKGCMPRERWLSGPLVAATYRPTAMDAITKAATYPTTTRMSFDEVFMAPWSHGPRGEPRSRPVCSASRNQVELPVRAVDEEARGGLQPTVASSTP